MSEIIISNKHGTPTVSSLEVATNFDKKHKNVIRDIEKLIALEEEKEVSSKLSHPPLFFETIYQHPQNKQFYKCYEITRDGFALLAMGFTGKKAYTWKLKYIYAFNEMEQRLLTNESSRDRIENEQMFFYGQEEIPARDFGEISTMHKALLHANYSIAQLSDVVKCILPNNLRNERKIMQNIDLDTLKSYLPQYVESVTEKRKNNTYNCPLCKSGTGRNKTAAFTLYPEEMRWYCHACKQGGSIIDLYLDIHQMSRESRENISRAIDELGTQYGLLPTSAPAQRNPAPLPVVPGKREHIYRNAEGNILAKKTIDKKADGTKKTCWYLRNTATGGYSYGLQGHKMPLYHADILHISKSTTVYIVEGEKDVETLENCYSFTATCTPNGGGQTGWNNLYNADLKDRDLIIITDNDEPGAKYGNTVAKNLSGIAKSIKIIPAASIWDKCPDKGDISDIIEALGKDKTAQLLSQAVQKARPYDMQKGMQSQKRKKFTSVYDVDGTGVLTIENLSEYLKRNGYSVNYDEILHDYTYSGFKGESPEHLKETAPDIIYDKLQFELKGCSSAKIAKMLTVIATRNRVNPIRTMIEDTVWDGKDRLEEIYNMFGIDQSDTMSRTLFRKWSMQAIAGLYNRYTNPFSLDIVLVFQGAQGIAKTRFFEHLAMKPTYFGEGYSIDTRNKDDIIQVTCNWIVELGEIGSTMRKDMDSLKAFLTKSMDEYRTPYGRAALKYPRMTSFVGTVNDDRYLIDETGNRRFATIPIKPGISLSYEDQIVPFDSLQFWAQIYSIVFAEVESGATIGGCFRLTNDEKEELEKRNSGFVKLLKGEMEVLDIIASLQEIESVNPNSIEYRLATTTDFKNAHFELSKYSSVQIGRVLNKLGFPETLKKVCGQPTRLRKLPFVKYSGY